MSCEPIDLDCMLDSVEASIGEADCVWWMGLGECGLCGYKAAYVIPIDPSLSEPVVPMECGSCGAMTVRPA